MRRLESRPALEVVQHLARRRGSGIGQGAVLGGCDHVARAGENHEGGNAAVDGTAVPLDRKSTRLNSSHGYTSYAVFCLKKKKQRFRGDDLQSKTRRHGNYLLLVL